MGMFSGFLNSAKSILTGDVGGAIQELTGSKAAAERNQQFALQQMAKSYQYQKETMQNQRQWTAQDLAAAGINQALAANTTNSAAAPTAGQGNEQSGAGMLASLLTAGITSAEKALKIGQEISILDAQEKSIDSGTAKTQAETAKTLAEIPYVAKKEDATIRNLTTNAGKTIAQTTATKGTGNYVAGKVVENLENTAKNTTTEIKKEVDNEIDKKANSGKNIYNSKWLKISRRN